jgi:hypothetical protein
LTRLFDEAKGVGHLLSLEGYWVEKAY